MYLLAMDLLAMGLLAMGWANTMGGASKKLPDIVDIGPQTVSRIVFRGAGRQGYAVQRRRR